MSSPSTDTAQRGSAPSEPAEQQAEGTQVHSDLVDTLSTPADKTDAGGRVTDNACQIKAQAVEKVQQAPQMVRDRPAVTAAVVAAVLLMVVLLVRGLWRAR